MFRTFSLEKSSSEDFTHVHIDFCSEKLYDYFIDRKFCRFDSDTKDKNNQKEINDIRSNYVSKEITNTDNSLIVNNLINCSKSDSLLLLAPPPDPPKTFSTIKNDTNVNLSSNNNNINANNTISNPVFLSRLFFYNN